MRSQPSANHEARFKRGHEAKLRGGPPLYVVMPEPPIFSESEISAIVELLRSRVDSEGSGRPKTPDQPPKTGADPDPDAGEVAVESPFSPASTIDDQNRGRDTC